MEDFKDWIEAFTIFDRYNPNPETNKLIWITTDYTIMVPCNPDIVEPDDIKRLSELGFKAYKQWDCFGKYGIV